MYQTKRYENINELLSLFYIMCFMNGFCFQCSVFILYKMCVLSQYLILICLPYTHFLPNQVDECSFIIILFCIGIQYRNGYAWPSKSYAIRDRVSKDEFYANSLGQSSKPSSSMACVFSFCCKWGILVRIFHLFVHC